MDYGYGSVSPLSSPAYFLITVFHCIHGNLTKTTNISCFLSYVDSRFKTLDMHISFGIATGIRKTVGQRDRGYNDIEGNRTNGTGVIKGGGRSDS